MKVWNYLYYGTWALLNYLAKVLIERPIEKLFNSNPSLSKKWKEGKSSYKEFTYSSEASINVSYSYGIMIVTTTLICGMCCILLIIPFDKNIDTNLKYYFIGIFLVSYLINYKLLWYRETYKKHFKIFEKKNMGLTSMVSAGLFHLIVLLLFALCLFL